MHTATNLVSQLERIEPPLPSHNQSRNVLDSSSSWWLPARYSRPYVEGVQAAFSVRRYVDRQVVPTVLQRHGHAGTSPWGTSPRTSPPFEAPVRHTTPSSP